MHFRPLLLWLLVFSPFRSFEAAWQPQPAEPKAFNVRGKVVNSTTGEPIHGALVQLFAGRPRSRLTGPDGQFVFEDVPAGTFAVQVRKPGFFFAPQLPFSAASPPMIIAGPDEPPPATLKLIPEGIIYGHLFGDSGEPLESLPVQVFCERTENGRKARTEFRSTNTDLQGEFRLAELPPGRYFVLAGPSRVPSSFSARPSQGGARGYAAAFYPSGPDLASAAPIEIAPGKHLEINWTLSSQPFYRISGTVNADLRHQSLSLQLTRGGQALASGFQIDPEIGTFRTQWLPAGLYKLTGRMHDPSTGQELFAMQNLNLTSNVTVRLMMVPSLNIPVTFQVQTTRSDSQPGPALFGGSGLNATRNRQTYVPARVVLTLQEQALSPRQFYAEAVDGDEAAVIHNLLPGAYSIEAFPNGPYYVQAVRSGALNLLEQNLMVGAGGSLQPIEVVLRDDFATLDGSVALQGEGQSGMVVVIPEDSPQRARNANLFWQPGVPGADRQTAGFEISQLAPGSYRVLVVDDPSFEYENPDVLQKYLSQAQEILLGPNQRTKVTLGVVHVGD